MLAGSSEYAAALVCSINLNRVNVRFVLIVQNSADEVP